MGIISYIKRRFSKHLLPSNDLKKHLVYVSRSKKEKIWFDKKLVVPNGFTLFFALKGKVLDEFPPGEHETSHIYLNKTIRTLRLNKKAKAGDVPKWFCADAYYINLEQSPVRKWQLYTKAEFFDSQIGYFKAMLSGNYVFKVKNARLFLSSLLEVYDYLLPHEGQEMLDGKISETAFNLLLKKNFDYKKLNNKEDITDFLFEKVELKLKKIGVELLGLSVENVRFSKSTIKKAKALDFDKFPQKIENTNSKIDENLEVNEKDNQKEIYYEDLQSIIDNRVVSEEDSDIADAFGLKDDSKASQVESMQINEFEAKEKTCLYCGEGNDYKSNFCSLCGERFV